MKTCSDLTVRRSACGQLQRGQRSRAAFTMIEILVAMAILLIIVAIVGQIFQQASVAWSTGVRSVEKTMKGRAVAELIAGEIGSAISNQTYSSFVVDNSGADFWMLGEASATTNAARHIIYNWAGTTVTRTEGTASTVDVADGIDDVAIYNPGGTAAMPLPPYITVTVTVSSNKFVSKAFLHHRTRYLY